MDISGVIAHGLAIVRFTACRAFDGWRRNLFQGAARGKGAVPWQPGQALPIAAYAGQGKRDLTIRLAAEDVFIRRVELPIAAWGRRREVAAFSLGQWTPFPPGGAAWDLRVAGGAARPGFFAADIAAISRHAVDDLLQSAGNLGYRLVSIAVPCPGGDFELLEAGRRAVRRRSRLRAGAAILLVALLAGVGLAWDRRLNAEIANLQAEVARLRPVAAVAAEQRRQRVLALLPQTLAVEAAGRAPLGLLATLTRLLPQDVHLVELRQDGAAVDIRGFAGDAPGLLAILGSDSAFEAPQFTAPVMQMVVESRGLFSIRFRYRGVGP